MSDDIERRLEVWLAERGRVDDHAIRAAATRIGALPDRRRLPRHVLPATLLAAAAALVLAVVAVGPFVRLPGTGGDGPGPVPPGPRRFAGDARLAACGATVDRAHAAFELVRARDYRHHLPAMGRSPELETDAPGFAVVYAEAHPYGGASHVPGTHDVCILVGADPATVERHVYTGVDITGLRADAPLVAASAAPTTTPTAPAWTDVLDCARPIETGVREIAVHGADSPAAALERFLALAWFTASPLRGYDAGERWGNLVAFRYRAGGVVKAVVVIRDPSPGTTSTPSTGHVVVGSPSCGPEEFDPADGLTGSPGVWIDAAGVPIPPARLDQRDDCYGGTRLRLDGALFVRDPLGGAYDLSQLRGRYDPDAALPPDASDTGYRSGLRALRLAADGSAAFIAIGDRVERWPRIRGDDYQRTDCN